MVAKGVYEAGFEALRRHLRRDAARAARSPRPMSWPARLTGQAVMLKRFGGAEAFPSRTSPCGRPGRGEVRIRQAAVGINYIDVYIRQGEYTMVTPPAPIGMEAAGTVVDVGPDVHGLLPGDRVAYAYGVPGAYATLRTLPADQVVPVPAASTSRPRRRCCSRA